MRDESKLLKGIVQPLTQWFRANKREMPWRVDTCAYHVWISEIMLQQTRIEAVIPYYERFLQAFPTVGALAAADEDHLMKHWEGLGYYSRARNLKKAACLVMEEYGGRLPETARELRRLPGIGEYTAGAVASISYGQPEPAVDGNVLRVIMRLAACDDDIMLLAVRKAVTQALREVYPTGSAAGDFTQGLMELGETVCIPNARPRCESCPVRELCRGFKTGSPEAYPVRSAKKERRIEEKTVLLLSCGEYYALHRREDKGLLANMWEFPNLDGEVSKERLAADLEEYGLGVVSCSPCGKSKHVFTHVEWHMTGFHVVCDRMAGPFLWKTVKEIQSEHAIPTAFRYYKNKIV